MTEEFRYLGSMLPELTNKEIIALIVDSLEVLDSRIK
jgi:hypothetical protein